ncbi:MAG: 30S ribosomal protein S7 [bacterium]
MPRRKVIQKRKTLPDSKYNSKLAAKFINCLMNDGKKSVAERIFYGALEILKDRTHDDPMEIFKQAVQNVRPVVEVKSRRVGGSTYQIPIDVRRDRGLTLGIRWLVNFSRSRSGKSMQECLANELMDAFNKRGAAIKKKDDIHRMADANRAFAHYRW